MFVHWQIQLEDHYFLLLNHLLYCKYAQCLFYKLFEVFISSTNYHCKLRINMKQQTYKWSGEDNSLTIGIQLLILHIGMKLD